MHFSRFFTLIVLVGFLLMGASTSFSQVCPTKDTAEKAMAKAFKQELQVEKVATSVIPGLCQAVIKFRGQSRVVYMDTKGEFIIAGQIFSASEGVNITAETVKELNRFSRAELAKLDDLVAFTVGKKGKTFFFVTDPQCPYCKKGEEVITKMVASGAITAKFLLYPLAFHKGSKEEAISIICDNKGLEGLKTNYKSQNQCAEGKKKVEDTVKFLQSKGVLGTPTYIFTDGLPHSGFLKEDQLRKVLGKVEAGSKKETQKK